MMEKKLLVEGMMCNHCKATVEKALSGVPGVTSAVVDLEAKTATVTLSQDVADSALFDAVKAKGFDPVKVL